MDLHLKPQDAITYRRPHEDLQSPNTIRVFTISPGKLVLQLRTERGFTNVWLTPDEADKVCEMLKQAADDRRNHADK